MPRSSRSSIVRCLVAATLALLAVSGPVRAEKQDARKHYDKATAAFGLGNFADAAAEYEAAFRLRPDPALLYNCAQSYRLAGNKVRAAELYRNYVRLYGETANAEDARRHLNDLERDLAAEHTGPTSPGAPTTTREATPPTSEPTAVVPTTSPPVALDAPPPPAPAPTIVETPRPATDANDGERPLYQRTWFWVAVGAAVVGGTVAILLATKRDSDPTASFGSFPVN